MRDPACLYTGRHGRRLVYNLEDFRTIVSRGLSASLVRQVLIEESVEVGRSSNSRWCATPRPEDHVCFIENIDAMGVHTGDSFCSAGPDAPRSEPALQEKLQQYSYAIVDAIGVIGGTNIQFAHDPRRAAWW